MDAVKVKYTWSRFSMCACAYMFMLTYMCVYIYIFVCASFVQGYLKPQYTSALKMETTILAETLENLQHSARLIL
jgi:hypothetical protein